MGASNIIFLFTTCVLNQIKLKLKGHEIKANDQRQNALSIFEKNSPH